MTRRADAVADMNLFRLCGDVSHVVSIVVLALRLNATRIAQRSSKNSWPPAYRRISWTTVELVGV